MAQIRVLVAESSDITLTGILTILSGSPSIKVTGTARTAPDVLRLQSLESYDLLLLSNTLKDLHLNDFMQKLQKKERPPRVILLVNTIDIIRLNQALKAGVNGCLTKNIGKKEFRNALVSAASGERVFSETIVNLMSGRYADLARSRRRGKLEQITKREAEVLQLIVEGHTSQEIANILYISPRTVETHRSNLLQKLDIKNTAGLVKYALEQGHFSS